MAIACGCVYCDTHLKEDAVRYYVYPISLPRYDFKLALVDRAFQYSVQVRSYNIADTRYLGYFKLLSSVTL